MQASRRKWILICGIVGISCAFVVYFSGDPIIRVPDWAVRRQILAKTPIGTGHKTVREYLDRNKRVFDEQHYRDVVGVEISQRGDKRSIEKGKSSIRASLGDYQGIPFRCNVTAYWVFDGQDTLINVLIWRTYDGL
jgi:hypothetical protein